MIFFPHTQKFVGSEKEKCFPFHDVLKCYKDRRSNQKLFGLSTVKALDNKTLKKTLAFGFLHKINLPQCIQNGISPSKSIAELGGKEYLPAKQYNMQKLSKYYHNVFLTTSTKTALANQVPETLHRHHFINT